MKKTKREKLFIDTGFGFPVALLNVPMIEIRGVWTPNIDYTKLSDEVLKSLVTKPARLTGNEVRFIRLTFEMTLKEFAKRFYVTHPCVINWEKEKDKSTGMNWITEKDIRLFVFDKITEKEDFRPVYEKLEKEPDGPIDKKPEIDIKKLAVA
jgi:hypothetical protein